jgi:tripartite-type tricarboxylate transporter receptor subunit TctC
MVAALNEDGLTPNPSSREDLAKFISKKSATYAKLIKDKNITED